MKKLLLSVAAAAAMFAPAAQAVEIYGVWVREGHPTDKLEFFDCAGKLCAKGVLPMLDGSPAPMVLRHAPKIGPNNWKGDLFNPEDGKTYTGKITYEPPNQLTLTGCLVAFLCQSETWTRVSGPTKPAAPSADNKPHDAKPADKAHEAAKPGDKAHEAAKSPEKAHDAAKPGEKPHDAAATKPAEKHGETRAAAKPAPKTGE